VKGALLTALGTTLCQGEERGARVRWLAILKGRGGR
jgi:hypothetical protein